MGIKWLLVLVVATSLLATGAAYSASPAAEDAIRNLPSDLPPQARVDRLDAAISTEKRQKTPDAYFLLWTLSRKAELLGNKSDPLAVCKEGLGRPTEAVATAQEALSYADRAAKLDTTIGPTPSYLKYQLLELIGRRSFDQYKRQELAFAKAHPVSLDLDHPHPPPPRWEAQPEAKQLDEQAEAALRKALVLETSKLSELWQPRGEDRVLVRRLLVDILWRQERWRDLFDLVLDLENLAR